jgi:hypothetical protein
LSDFHFGNGRNEDDAPNGTILLNRNAAYTTDNSPQQSYHVNVRNAQGAASTYTSQERDFFGNDLAAECVGQNLQQVVETADAFSSHGREKTGRTSSLTNLFSRVLSH